jgi:trehalose 6-phosphate synthase/phosphatase
VDKATAVRALLKDLHQQQDEVDFLLCIGDSKTDEPVFTFLKEVCSTSITSTVGKKQTDAKYYIDNVKDVEKLLDQLSKELG